MSRPKRPSKLTVAQDTYIASVSSTDRVPPRKLAKARGALIDVIAVSLRDGTLGEKVIATLRASLSALGEAPSLSDTARAFEHGAIDALFRLVRVDEVMQLDEATHRVSKNARSMRLLRVLADVGESSHSELVVETREDHRTEHGEITSSERSGMSRRIGRLLEAGVVQQVSFGKERLVSLTPKGVRLVRVADEGKLPWVEPSPEIPEIRIRTMLVDSAAHPHVDFPADDRSRFFIFAAGVEVTRALVDKERWRSDERILANLVWQHPLSDWPQSSDDEVFRIFEKRWRGQDDTALRVMQAAFRHQLPSQRDSVAQELMGLAIRLKKLREQRGAHDKLELVWASVALNAASWYFATQGSRLETLETAVDKVLERRREPLASHLRAAAAHQRGHYTKADEHWLETERRCQKRLEDLGPSEGGGIKLAVRRITEELLLAARINLRLNACARAFGPVLADHFNALDSAFAATMPEALARQVEQVRAEALHALFANDAVRQACETLLDHLDEVLAQEHPWDQSLATLRTYQVAARRIVEGSKLLGPVNAAPLEAHALPRDISEWTSVGLATQARNASDDVNWLLVKRLLFQGDADAPDGSVPRSVPRGADDDIVDSVG